MRTMGIGIVIVAAASGVLLPLFRQGKAEREAQAAPSDRAAPAAADAAKVYGEWSIQIRPDKGKEYDQLIREKGLPLFREAGGRMVGWWKTLIGDLYEHVTIWEYDGLPAFEKAVQFLQKDERFARFVEARDPLLAGERSSFLKLAGFAEKPSLPDAAKFVIHEIHRVPLSRQEAYLLFMEKQLPVLRQHGFRPAGPWLAAVGDWSEVTYLFRFESLAERDRLIASFSSQEAGRAYREGVVRFVEAVRTRLLVSAPFAQ